jgi:putative FmdB family regulatory protein
MPVYEYACGACDARFEELVSLAAADAVQCPACGAAGAERLLSRFQRTRAGAASEAPALAAAGGGGGGCCGGGCGCGG